MKKIFTLLIIMISFYTKGNAKYEQLATEFSFDAIEGKVVNLSYYKGSVVLVVNVASRCGFTNQYKDLQSLWTKYKDKGLVIVGVPSNNFRQEPGSNKEIKTFCESTFGIDFPITGKTEVIGAEAHPFFLWAKKNHGVGAIPKLNFHKILINKEGKVQDTYNSFIDPLSKKIINQIDSIL